MCTVHFLLCLPSTQSFLTLQETQILDTGGGSSISLTRCQIVAPNNSTSNTFRTPNRQITR